jgi:thymidylate synthase ThyX
MKGTDWTVRDNEAHRRGWAHRTGWCCLTEAQQAIVENAFAGGSLQQDLEGINFWFTIDGVSRAFTHEFVRTRLGAAFKQHGGRDNDWRHRHWTMTESMERVCAEQEINDEHGTGQDVSYGSGKRHPIIDWKPIDKYLTEAQFRVNDSLREAIYAYLQEGKHLYAALVDAGVAWQDARRLLTIGSQTYIHGIYNYVGLRGAAANRLEFIMDWEINCVFQLMVREIKMKCPPIMSKYLGSHSDLAGRAMFDRLQLCPPDGKWPSTTIVCFTCGHTEANHLPHPDTNDLRMCEACERGDHPRGFMSSLHQFVPEDTLPRIFRREQQPFFVLHPDSMAGGPIKWLWTNGHYRDIDAQMTAGV